MLIYTYIFIYTASKCQKIYIYIYVYTFVLFEVSIISTGTIADGSKPSPVEVVRITIDHLKVDIFVKVASWKSKGIPPPIAPPRENKLIRPYDDDDDDDDDDDA